MRLASRGHLEVVEFLIQNGSNIHAENDESLLSASRYNNLEVVRLLIQNGAINDESLRAASLNGN